ncbi:MAG: DUF5060 domain-containing protein [Desulfopila sp.]|jgi:hypothetical protein|nr:DUF5060 domain-containing protein [Desulfopila sp.]
MNKHLRYAVAVFLGLFLLFPQVLYANSVVGFTLINADSNAEIGLIREGDIINLSTLPSENINIRVNTSPAVVGRVEISLQGATVVARTEQAAPYALWGDNDGNYSAGKLNPGSHILNAIPYENNSAGVALQISFSVVDTALTMPRADAGKDRFLFPPDDQVVLYGSGDDPDGFIESFLWTQVDGPGGAVLNGEETEKLVLSSLYEGTYTFRFTVRDNDGNTAFDEVSVFVFAASGGPEAPIPTGELKKWHKVTLTFEGPQTAEEAALNPFTDYRLDVIFVNGSSQYTVPGYFAADGDAGNSGASQGNKWRVHFSPDRVGTWHYIVSFRTAAAIVASADSQEGEAVAPLDGMIGSFSIAPTDKTGRDHRGKGRLRYTGGRYLQFAETGEYFLKQGADAPENFLAYDGFDNTPDNGGRRKSWLPHVGDWQNGDPTWKGGEGKGIIGALNYLASEGMNAFSFLPMNINGDDRNVFPYISESAAHRTRMDCSKLDQWEKVFEHADRIGLFLHFKTQETENELLLDNGNLGIERIVYYRELIARFGHHLALNWNLGEEINNASTAQKKAWAQYFYDNDPYNHHIVIHNGSNHYDLLGENSKLTGFSLQTSREDFSQVHDRVKNYLDRSAATGKQWAVACDEPGDAGHALRPDNDAGNSHVDGRKNALWGTLMAGGWGNEWYFGYQHAHSDLTCEDFRSRDRWWDYCRIALAFFKNHSLPFWKMYNNNMLSSASEDYCMFLPGQVYAVYLKNGGATSLDLRNISGVFQVQWYNPRSGGALQNSSITTVRGGSWVNLGHPPSSVNQDWLVLVRKMNSRVDATISPILLLLQQQ